MKKIIPTTPNMLPPISTAKSVSNGDRPTEFPTTYGYMNWFSINCTT